MSRKYILLGNSNSENVERMNDNFAELYNTIKSVNNIYDDVEQLQAEVATLQTQVAALQALHTDTGWQNITLNSGWTYTYESDRPMYRKIGNHVFLRGLVDGSSAAGTVIANLPAEIRPGITFTRFPCSLNQTEQVNIEIKNDGRLQDWNKGSSARSFICLNSINYWV